MLVGRVIANIIAGLCGALVVLWIYSVLAAILEVKVLVPVCLAAYSALKEIFGTLLGDHLLRRLELRNIANELVAVTQNGKAITRADLAFLLDRMTELTVALLPSSDSRCRTARIASQLAVMGTPLQPYRANERVVRDDLSKEFLTAVEHVARDWRNLLGGS